MSDIQISRESLQGQSASLTNEAEIRQAVEQSFDYRGDVTLTLKSGETLEGYVFDRRPGLSLETSFLRLVSSASAPSPADAATRRQVAYSELAAINFSGRDTAAGKSWEDWVEKYKVKKASGEQNISLQPEPPE